MSLNKETLPLSEMWEIINEVISSGGEFRLYTQGNSMLPLLRSGKDSVVLVLPKEINIGDMVLYLRDDGQYVLHRIIKKDENGYVMCGDNQCELEYDITDKNIKAKVSYFYRDETAVLLDDKKYLKYVKSLKGKRKRLKVRIFLSKIKRKLFKRTNKN